MKTLKILSIATFLLVAFSCSNSDDEGSGDEDLTNEQLLTSGKWFKESEGSGIVSDCSKKDSLLFTTSGNITIVDYDDATGTCEIDETTNATYVLTNDVNIVVTLGSETLNATIVSISETQLTISTIDGTTIYDKTEG